MTLGELRAFFKSHSDDTPLFVIVPAMLDGKNLGNHILSTLAFDVSMEDDRAFILSNGFKIVTPATLEAKNNKLIELN